MLVKQKLLERTNPPKQVTHWLPFWVAQLAMDVACVLEEDESVGASPTSETKLSSAVDDGRVTLVVVEDEG